MNGRKPTPHALKVISGTERPDRESPDAPEFELIEEFPDPPQTLNVDGADMWNRLGPQLVMARVLQVVDLYVLEQLCYTWQRFKKKAKADADITAAENNALKALFAELGMTPASRRQITRSPGKDKGNSFKGNGKPPA